MKAWAANLLGAGVAAGTLAVALAAGGPKAEASGPAHPATIAAPAAPAGADEIGLGQAMRLFGRPARLTMFWTADSTEDVIQHYAEAWKDSKVPPIVRQIDRVSSISAIDRDSGLMRTVTVTDAGDVRVVVPSIMDARAFPDLTPKSAPVPIPENAHGYLAQAADDARSLSYHASFVVPLTPKRAVEFYEVELGKLGYAKAGPMTRHQPLLTSMTFTRGPEQVNVAATPTEKTGPTAAFVIVEDVRQIEQTP